MDLQDLCYTPAHQLVRLIAAGTLSARELVSAAVARAEAVQPLVNCIAVPLYEEAMAAAAEADARQARGEDLGPLHGVPITLKDGISTAGHKLTLGSASRRDVVGATDDVVWQRLRAAGAILIGKTTTPEFFHKVTTDSALYGVTRNPWSLDHSPGGSSGGAAAALASGIGALAGGTDGGGSLRCPASCTATIAIKPTMGRVPHASYPDTFGNYATIGPMARNVSDLSMMLEIMSGPVPADAASLGRSVETLRAQSAGMPRIGVLALADTDPAVVTLIEAALDRLAEAGAVISGLEEGLFEAAFDIYRVIASVGHAARARTASATEQTVWSDSFRSIVSEGLGYSADRYEAAQQARTRLFRSVQSVFERVDIIATPVLTRPPFLIEDQGSVGSPEYAIAAAGLYPLNLTGHPGISIPCGFTDNGLPVGLQLIAPWYGEAELLRLATVLESETLWTERRPKL